MCNTKIFLLLFTQWENISFKECIIYSIHDKIFPLRTSSKKQFCQIWLTSRDVLQQFSPYSMARSETHSRTLGKSLSALQLPSSTFSKAHYLCTPVPVYVPKARLTTSSQKSKVTPQPQTTSLFLKHNVKLLPKTQNTIVSPLHSIVETLFHRVFKYSSFSPH